ncbi:hypothetical protein OROMI_010038 [Orobanche minor]
MKVPVRHMPVADTLPPPLPPAPALYSPESPSRLQLISTFKKEQVEAMESECGPYITKPHFRDWTIQDLRNRYAKPFYTGNFAGFDIDVYPALVDDAYIFPLVCSVESHLESYQIFEDLAQLAIEHYNNHSAGFLKNELRIIWPNNRKGETNGAFWEYEWQKHGCYSCLKQVEYFVAMVKVSKQLKFQLILVFRLTKR